MTTPRTRKLRARGARKTAPDPKLLLARLRSRLEKERAGLDRWRQRLFRAAHAYERLFRLVARLERRITKLASA